MAGRIIYLEIDDEITTAAARIRDADVDRIAIVLPHGSRVATSRINFRLLSRDALRAWLAPLAANFALLLVLGLTLPSPFVVALQQVLKVLGV